jgi:hypothetical protein
MNTIEKKEPSFFGSIGSFFGKAEQAVVLKVDHVMQTFHNTIASLELVAETHVLEAAEHARVIEQRAAAKLAAEAEALRATGIAQKMKELIK